MIVRPRIPDDQIVARALAAHNANSRTRRRAPWWLSWLVLIAFGLALQWCSYAGADEPIHLRQGAVCKTGGGSVLDLRPGYYVTEEDWWSVDAQLRAAIDDGTRLRAENESLRGSVRHQAVWVGAALVVGALAGAGVVLYYEEVR